MSMKMALKISILLNLGLLGWLMLAPLAHEAKPPVQPQPIAAQPAPTQATAPALPTPNPAPARPQPFQWSQLYSKDYHVYVKNLQAIGCPAATLRAIVAADVHAVLQPRATELETKLAALATSSWVKQIESQTNAMAWKAELSGLPEEELAMVAEYLGEHPATTSPDLLAVHAAAPGTDEVPQPIVIPMVAQTADLTALNLDEGQLQAIKDLKQRFLQKIGGPNQDPNDPAYQARWRAAQAEVDNLTEGMIGNEAFQNYQLQVYADSQTLDKTPNPPGLRR